MAGWPAGCGISITMSLLVVIKSEVKLGSHSQPFTVVPLG